MSILANLSNRMIIEDTLCCDCSEMQVSNCDLSRISVEKSRWLSNSINNSNAPSMEFLSCVLDDVTFYRSNLEKSIFKDSKIVQSNFSGITLIKSEFDCCRFDKTAIKYCTLQRSVFYKSMFIDSSLVDFEGLNMEVSDCLFKNCRFEITGDGGMNGFSSSNIRSCIFVNCDFAGYPLRGANVISCVFNGCTGYIADDFNLQNSVGLESFAKCAVKEISIGDESKCKDFLNSWR